MSDDPASRVRPLQLSIRAFAVFLGVYLATWGGHYTSGDGAYKVAWAKGMITGHLTGPDQDSVYSKYGIGHSILAVTPLAIASSVHKISGIRCEAALYTLIFIINGAFFLGLVAFYLAHFYPARSVWRTVVILGLATIWWPYTKLDFSEPLVLTVAFLGFALMRFNHPVWGMLIGGFTLAIRSDSIAIVGPMIVWYLLSNRTVRNAVQIGGALLPSVALVLFSNYVRYRSLFDQGYSGERFSNPLWIGVYGILLSSGKSIFLFSPPLLLGVLGWRRFANRDASRHDAWLFLSILVAQVLIFAKWWDWSSDDAWGIRFLIPGVLLMCIPMVSIVEWSLPVVSLGILGLCVQLLAVTVGGLDYLVLLRSQRFQREALFVGGYNRVDFGDVRFNPSYSQIAGNWILLRYLIGIPPSVADAQDSQQVGTPLSDAIPRHQWSAAARWDFIWNIHPKRSDMPGTPSPTNSTSVP